MVHFHEMGEETAVQSTYLSPDEANFTIDEAVERVGFGLYQWRLLVLCGTAFIADAMEIVMLAFIVNVLQKELHCSSFVISIVASAVFVGMFFGSTVLGPVSDAIGRRKSFAICMAFTGLAGLLSAASQNVWMFLVTRALVGVGVGGLHISVTLFTEFLPTRHRALQNTLLQVFWALGVVIQTCLAWAMRDVSWRWYVVVSAFPAFISGATYFLIPESPLYLLIHGRKREAVAILRAVAHVNGTIANLPHSFDIHVPPSIAAKDSFYTRVKSMVGTKSLRRLTLCLLLVWFVGSFVYCGSVFLTAQLTYGDWNQYLAMFIVSLAELPGKLLSYWFFVYCGRRHGMTASSALTALSLVFVALQEQLPAWCVLVAMVIYRLGIAVFLTMAALYTPEAFPTAVRSTGFGITTAGSRIAGMLTPFIALKINSISPALSSSLYAVVTMLGLVAAFLLPFDTSKMSLAHDGTGRDTASEMKLSESEANSKYVTLENTISVL